MPPKKRFYEVSFVLVNKPAKFELPSPSFYLFFCCDKNGFAVKALVVIPRSPKRFGAPWSILGLSKDGGLATVLVPSDMPEVGPELKRLARGFCVFVVDLSLWNNLGPGAASPPIALPNIPPAFYPAFGTAVNIFSAFFYGAVG